MSRRRQRERGSEAIEAVIGMTAFVLFIGLIGGAGRIAMAQQAVEGAAADAARSASIARSKGAAGSSASASATASLANQKLRCSSRQVSVDTSGFAAPVGTPSGVSATVTCVVNLSDISIPGLPGSKRLSATMSSPLDTYRER